MNKEANKEIERKFLVDDRSGGWRNARYSEIRQGYLSIDKYRTVRVRTVHVINPPDNPGKIATGAMLRNIQAKVDLLVRGAI